MSVQSDCPAREKYGYGADVAACAEAFIHNFDMREFYAKTVRDNLDEARADGWFTDTAPYIGINDGGYGGRSGGIGWAMGVPVLADLIYTYYGDLTVTAEAYPAMARYAGLLAAKFPDDAIPTCIGDHLALDKVDNALSAQANWVRYLDFLELFARRLGRGGEAAEWAAKAKKARSAFCARHVKDGVVGSRLTQGGQAFALKFGLVGDRKRAADLLARAVAERGYALSTGLQCTNFLLEELSAAGLWKEVEAVVSREDFPGWLYMERQGATTLWERWRDPKPIHSFDHPMFGHVDAWMKKYILGIRLAPGAVGGDKVIIDPKPLCGVEWAKGSLSVATGTIEVEWKLRPDGSVDLKCKLPQGTERVEK
jgi:alpha-L-rhamnosidase